MVVTVTTTFHTKIPIFPYTLGKRIVFFLLPVFHHLLRRLPYTAVDGRRLVAVTNTKLRALVLGGVSMVASRAILFATNTGRRCLNSMNVTVVGWSRV